MATQPACLKRIVEGFSRENDWVPISGLLRKLAIRLQNENIGHAACDNSGHAACDKLTELLANVVALDDAAGDLAAAGAVHAVFRAARALLAACYEGSLHLQPGPHAPLPDGAACALESALRAKAGGDAGAAALAAALKGGDRSLPAGRLLQVVALAHALGWQLRGAPEAPGATVRAAAIETAAAALLEACVRLPGYAESELARA